jgi:hypothetical protein
MEMTPSANFVIHELDQKYIRVRLYSLYEVFSNIWFYFCNV